MPAHLRKCPVPGMEGSPVPVATGQCCWQALLDFGGNLMTRMRARAGIGEPATEGAPGQSAASRHYIIGIGASVGAPQALANLVSHLPAGLEASLVVIHDLPPTGGCSPAQALSGETAVSVEPLMSGQVPQCGVIYLAPPDREVQLRDGILLVRESPPDAATGNPLDVFLESLAQARGEDAVGVVLSGNRGDGAGGIRAVKAAGGLTIAQDPRTAECARMPLAAIDTGCVDRVLSPQEIAREIVLLCDGSPPMPADDSDWPEPSWTALTSLLAMLRAKTCIDFSGYKEATLWRRVGRRMIAMRTPTVEGYLDLVAREPGELERLAKDFLMPVTSFFRDREVFAALEPHVGQLVERKHAGEDIRVWVPGCATGEEAYSLAIVFHRLLGARFDAVRLQVFATDVDMDALQIARHGVYPAAALNDLDPRLVSRYFSATGGRYAVIKSIHDVVAFGRQDLALDPPHLRLDLISCRNLLVYRKEPLQAKILSLFHYALLPDGLLLLGRSENLTQVELLFVAKDSAARIYSRRTPAGGGRPPPPAADGKGLAPGAA